MLLSEELKFAFIHVPKCGGTSLRQYFRAMPGIHNPLAEIRGQIPFPTDPNHVQMAVLRDHAPDLLDRIAACTSYAVLRDPVSRFPSALAQHCKMFREQGMDEMSLSDLRRVTDEAIAHLQSGEVVRDRRYIHFERQTAFTHLDGVQVVTRLFRLDNQAGLADDVAETTGYRAPALNESNQSASFRNATLERIRLGFPQPVKRVLRDHLPLGLKKSINRMFFRPNLTEDRRATILTPETRAFIAEHYAADFKAYDAA